MRLNEQDRGSWDPDLVAEGLAIVQGLRDTQTQGETPLGRFALLAEVNAVHLSAPHPRDTDWARIVALYEQLERIDPNPLVTLSRAVAIAERDGAEAGVTLLDQLGERLAGSHPFHVARAELLGASGRIDEAVTAYDAAIALAVNPAEIAHLAHRRNLLAPPAAPDASDAIKKREMDR